MLDPAYKQTNTHKKGKNKLAIDGYRSCSHNLVDISFWFVELLTSQH